MNTNGRTFGNNAAAPMIKNRCYCLKILDIEVDLFSRESMKGNIRDRYCNLSDGDTDADHC